MPEVFGVLDDLVQQGKIRFYGVSVERVDEALKAITYPNLQSIQIIFNMFRLKPAEQFFAAARERGVGILARDFLYGEPLPTCPADDQGGIVARLTGGLGEAGKIGG